MTSSVQQGTLNASAVAGGRVMTTAPKPTIQAARKRSLWRDAVNRFARNKIAVGGAIAIMLMIAIAIIGPFISPYDYTRQDYLATNLSPSWSHWLGTDALGRDYFTRLMMGARTAFLLATWVVSLTMVLGTVLGAISGYLGGWVDTVIMRIGDAFMAFPTLLLALFISGAIRPPVAEWSANYDIFRDNSYLIDYAIVFGALAAVSWAGMARLMRAQVIMLRNREFVTASQSIGASNRRIIANHLLPNTVSPIVVTATASVANVMVLESSLSFFGIGVRPPAASWGSMIGENLTTWQHSPCLLAAPAIALAVTALCFNFIGDGLNDALDPQRQH